MRRPRLPRALRRLTTVARSVTEGAPTADRDRRLVLSPIPAVLIVLLLAVTVGAFLALRAHVEATEGTLLRNEAQQGIAVFNAVAQEVEATVTGGAAVGEATNGDVDAFRQVMADRAEQGFLSSLTLFRSSGPGFEAVAEVGRRSAVLPRRLEAGFEERIREVAASGRLELVALRTLDGMRLVGLAGPARPDAEYVAYAEILIPDVLSTAGIADPGTAEYALYFGDEVGSALATTNASALPIQGRRVTSPLRLGDERPTLVFAATQSLAGAFTRSLPWIVLGIGLAVTMVLAALVETGHRRRRQARALVADLGVASDRLDQSEQRFSRLFEQATDLIFVTDLDGILTSVNRSFEKLIGYGRDELVGRRFEELVAPEYRDRARRARERKVAGVVDTTTYEFDLVASDGSVLELEVTSQLTRDNGEAVGVQCIARDVSERKRLEGRFRSLVQNASDVILVVSPDGTIRYVTPSAALVLGKGEAELVGGDLATMVHPSDRRRIMAFLAAAEHQDATGAAELRVHAGGDRWRYFEVLANDLTADAAVRGIVLTMRDVTDRKELEEQLTFQAFHDPLTGLANRALFTDRVSHSLAHRSAPARRVAVLFIDVDDFKTVNDSLGHDAGDQLLVQVADRLRAALRLGDTCARLGGDEFGVLLEQVPDVDYAVRVAERLGTAVAEPVAIEGREMALQTSIGVALQDPRGSSAHELLRNADIAMYLAKRDQLSRCRVFEPYMHTAALNRLELKGQLEQALARDEFTIQYQPIVSVATGRIAAIEALVRWHHPQRGLLAPSEFVELAEESGLIVPLGRWVLNEACHAARRWRERAPGTADLALSVNLSVRQLHGNGLPEQIDAILASHQCDPASLILEITESDLARDQASATEKLVRLRRLGVRIAVDDFGTGYSSLSLLHEYPVDILKIAKPFVDDLATGPAATLTSAIVSLGRTLGLETVAEGIETPEQRAELRRLGCDYGQGFLFSPPLTSDALERYLAQRVDVPQPAPIDGAVVDGTVVPPAA